MSLSPQRAVASVAGACTGGVGTAALVTAGRGEYRTAGRWLLAALVAGASSITFDEAAQSADN